MLADLSCWQRAAPPSGEAPTIVKLASWTRGWTHQDKSNPRAFNSAFLFWNVVSSSCGSWRVTTSWASSMTSRSLISWGHFRKAGESFGCFSVETSSVTFAFGNRWLVEKSLKNMTFSKLWSIRWKCKVHGAGAFVFKRRQRAARLLASTSSHARTTSSHARTISSHARMTSSHARTKEWVSVA